MHSTRPLLWVALATCITAPAFAATIVVSKNGAVNSFATAITNSAAGDTIKVLPGVYSERNLTIPNTKTGLTIVGIGKVILDATEPTPGDWSKGLVVEAADVTIRGITIRGAENMSGGFGGTAIDVVADNVTIDRCVVIGCQYAGVIGVAPSITILDTRFQFVKRPIRLSVETSTIRGCVFESCTGDNINVAGSNASIEKCTFRNVSYFEDSDLNETGRAAIKATATTVAVRNCKVDSAPIGIQLSCTTATVKGCNVTDTSEAGIWIDTGSAEVSKCRVNGVRAGAGIYVIGNSTMVVRDNQVSDVAYQGISVISSDTTIEDNVVEDGGAESIGIRCPSPDALIRRNVVRRFLDGISVLDSGCVIEDNVVESCARDGINAVSNFATIRSNVVRNNQGEGIENDGVMVILEQNVCSKNRIDIANTGTIATFTGNKFKSGGTSTAPESD